MTDLHVAWTGRFMNERHDVRHWLEPLSPNKHVDPLYDDYFGVRTIDWHPNVQGNCTNGVLRPLIQKLNVSQHITKLHPFETDLLIQNIYRNSYSIRSLQL